MSSSAELLQPVKDHQPVPTAQPAWGGAGVVSSSPDTSCPWTSASAQDPTKHTSFRDLMSEDLAKTIQEQENEDYYTALIGGTTDTSNLLELGKVEDTSEDLILAQMLQYEFDREYDQHVTREEKHYNGSSKVSVSFNKFKVCPDWYGPDSDDELHELDEENRALDSFEAREREEPVIPPCGYVKQGKKFVTKHDLKICGRKNAERIMNLPPGINTGDGGGFDFHLSNKVYNNLQRAAIKENKNKHRIHDKVEKATSEMALDPDTRLLIFKLVNNAILESVNGIISSGKEAVVFHAQGGENEERPLPEEVAVKVFKTRLTDFKTRERYIREDYRFKDRMSRNTQKSIRLWAEKEYHNLRRLQRAAIPSPQPILIKKHVLIMSFIGRNNHAAPKLKDAILSFSELCIAYEHIVEAMVKMFHGCHLIHADLSEYNILWHEGLCWIIDVGQAVEPTHPQALHFLHRDCTNIIKFFKAKGVPELPTPLKLFEKVSGISLPGTEDEAFRLIDEYEHHQELWSPDKNNTSEQFEFLWEEIKAEEQERKNAKRGMVEAEEEESTPDEDNELLDEFVIVDEMGEEVEEMFKPNHERTPRRKDSEGSSSVEGGARMEMEKHFETCTLDEGKKLDNVEKAGKTVRCKVSFLDEDSFPSLSSAAPPPVCTTKEEKPGGKQGKKKKTKKKSK